MREGERETDRQTGRDRERERETERDRERERERDRFIIKYGILIRIRSPIQCVVWKTTAIIKAFTHEAGIQ